MNILRERLYIRKMQEEDNAPPPKRPRFVTIDELEVEELREKVRRQEREIFTLKIFGERRENVEEVNINMEKEKKKIEEQKRDMEEQKVKMEEEKKHMEAEKKMLKEKIEEELKGLIECPVCLMVPRERAPVPVCSNGHIVCRPCRDRIRQEAREEVAKCPSCMVDLGNATSLIASRLVEKVKHECDNEGCDEMFDLSHLESHQKVCVFRKVRCPGSVLCKLEMPFNKVKEHVKSCRGTDKDIFNNNSTLEYQFNQEILRENDRTCLWPTCIVAAHDKMFYLRHKKEKSYHIFETIMLGSEKEGSKYLASITIQKADQIITKLASQPRPIDLQSWGDVEMGLSGKTLSKMLKDNLTFEFTLSIEKSE